MRTLIVTLLAGAVLWSATDARAQSQEHSAAELIEKWSTALGGKDRLAQIETLYSQWKVATAGLEGTVSEWTTRKGQCREELNLGGLYSTLTVFDGESGWLLDHNGKVRELQGVDMETRITSAYFSTFSHLLEGRRAGSVQYLGRDDSGRYHRL